MSKSTKSSTKPKPEYDTSKFSNVSQIRKQAIPKDKPLVKGVEGYTGLKVNIEEVSGRTTFILMVKHPTTGKYKRLHVGDFDIPRSKDNLTIQDAIVRADKVKTEWLNQVEHEHQVKSTGGLPTPNSTYREVAEAWFKKYSENPKWSAATKIKHEGCLNKIYESHLADMPFHKVDRYECIPFLEKVEASTLKGSQGENVRKTMNLISTYAQNNIRGAVFVNLKETLTYDDANLDNRPVLPKDCRPNYQKCDLIKSKLMRLACKLAHHVFLRSGEVTTHFEKDPKTKKVIEVLSAEWDEIDFKERVWIVPGPRMKKKVTHLVPLSDQTISILDEIKQLTSIFKDCKYIFPNMESPNLPIDENLLATTLRQNKIGYRPMDIRKLAGDWLKNNSTDRYTVEVQLAHKQGDKVENAYVISSLYYQLAERRIAMQKWSDYLEPSEKKVFPQQPLPPKKQIKATIIDFRNKKD
jgi:hypothetical protein